MSSQNRERETAAATTSSQSIAEAAAFRSFANGYLREIDPGIRVHHALPDGPPAPCVEWNLRSQRMAIRAEIVSPSLCGALLRSWEESRRSLHSWTLATRTSRIGWRVRFQSRRKSSCDA